MADWKVVLHLPEIETWLRATSDRVTQLTHSVGQDGDSRHVDAHLVQLKVNSAGPFLDTSDADSQEFIMFIIIKERSPRGQFTSKFQCLARIRPFRASMLALAVARSVTLFA